MLNMNRSPILSLKYHALNLTVCQDPKVLEDDQGEILSTCCACGEAKYELAFEGLWSRYTHPKVKRQFIAENNSALNLTNFLEFPEERMVSGFSIDNWSFAFQRLFYLETLLEGVRESPRIRRDWLD